jgi:hypothetical protein
VIRRIFSKFGRINNIHIVYDRGVSFHVYAFIIHIENQFFPRPVDLVVLDLFIMII